MKDKIKIRCPCCDSLFEVKVLNIDIISTEKKILIDKVNQNKNEEQKCINLKCKWIDEDRDICNATKRYYKICYDKELPKSSLHVVAIKKELKKLR